MPHLTEGAAAARDRAGDDDLLHDHCRPPTRRRHRRLPSTSRLAARRAHAYPSARTTAPMARWIWPQSGIAVSAIAAQTNRRRSSASSTAGSRNAIRPSRWPVDWPSRYGARAKTRPPTSAAPRASPSARSHQHVSAPAATIERRTTRLYAQMFPSSAPQRPEGDPEQPPLQVRGRARLRPERVRVGPRRARRARAGARGARTPSRAGGDLRPPPRRGRRPAARDSGRRLCCTAGHVAHRAQAA